MEYKIIVGLEIHVHLATQTKMFCGCRLAYGDAANTHVCPVCLGLPGALPVMNKQALEFAILTGLALNCRIARFTKWDRKSYYYPDLPKNYQISQYDLPFAQHGYIEIPAADGQPKKIRIRRVHLEEDAGKNVHSFGNFSAIDLNRAGAPLLEIVTEPDMNSPEEVGALARELQRIVRFLGVSEADMQKGHMRFEPNVNLHITRNGQLFKTPISEIKNLNSFRAIERSIACQVQRQLEDFLETGRTLQMGNKSTWGWDDERQTTVLQREKEEAHDYRYFPDPDLVPVEVDQAWLTAIQARLCELPLQMQMRFIQAYGLSPYDAAVLTADRATAEFFDAAAALQADPKRICNLLTQTGLKLANERGIRVDQLGLSAQQLAQLAQMTDAGLISATSAAVIFEEIAAHGGDPVQIAEKRNLLQKSDAGEIETLVDAVLAENVQAVADARSNPKKAKKALGFLMGQVIQKSKGQANPKIVSEILNRKLNA
ncbi:MAG TPA: Asp-tRNA(Asn)/Glu-tRNA(Gln) amidotransferase subunit GatB [Anaerohalosphaeraceae bacterium]|nr:Asp-tRNA(Asn)/Glu-tRNA(Gln) amidotransferase subunit GatB [Anaerohalosphaeraceae bacterium]HOM75512.1 Asp-tRNA(Asn)/Glu-tRNA(Gln) amidotransferase subunit GatB [Anaerohalosphaeraceae bacterium]HPC64913.1 Asp-tRNA(Asn)/Glu-tRNA(Gln) amidotransferase subunit GatB [Anaerohalosphaeraceae bacterium]HPO70012.1 Asp-tRNA(Asn)/Glu-tRNA(Gln) amidotransferase subunit GatB [Anaerohalosphaeraceae bacterium]HRS70660.1 Asp-tRNA(Asn)/Glu-tRNA(Gln) amidotransferase subunit GatB [Anaerohalosphaeraceae bacteri